MELRVDEEQRWEQCFKAEKVNLPKLGYIGFTALTGGVTSLQDIIDVDSYGIVNVIL
jgi:Legume-like lectin family